jgi:hypothetical protein
LSSRSSLLHTLPPPHSVFDCMVRPGLLFPVHCPCICHLLQLGISWYFRNPPMNVMLTQIKSIAKQFRRIPRFSEGIQPSSGKRRKLTSRLPPSQKLPSSSCPSYCPTRWLGITTVIDWIRQNASCFPPASVDNLIYIGLLLEPVRAAVHVLEADRSCVGIVFPVLLQMFRVLADISGSLPYTDYPELVACAGELRTVLWKITLGSDAGATFALAWALTDEGSKGMRDGTFHIPPIS